MTEDDLYKNLEDYSQEELEIQQKIAKESAKIMQEEMEDLTKELEKIWIRFSRRSRSVACSTRFRCRRRRC